MFKKQTLTLFIITFLTACSQTSIMQERVTYHDNIQTAAAAERLGTQWGDEVHAPVVKVNLKRINKEPVDQTQVFYADKNYRGRAIKSIALAAGKINFTIQSDNDRLPLFRDSTYYYLHGKAGQPYRLVYHNNSNKQTYEIVASVDGLDVLTGRKASRYHHGYVLKPNATIVIEGFRKNDASVASFIFSKPNDAYANNTPAGTVNNTGIIGTAIYELYNPIKGNPEAFPADKNSYAPAPQ